MKIVRLIPPVLIALFVLVAPAGAVDQSVSAPDYEFTPKSVETYKERVTLVYRIKIDLENSNHELKPGMPAEAIIDMPPKQ